MEELIEELTKVNPSNLSKEGLKLFNKINEIIDRNQQLERENTRLKYQDIPYLEGTIKGYKDRVEELKQENTTYKNQLNDAFVRGFIHNSKIKEIRDKAEVMDYYTLPDVIEDLNKLLEEE